MANLKLNIESDFVDYYDHLAIGKDGDATYVRKYSNSPSKGKAISELKKLNIQTILLGSVRDLASTYDKLVVYTDTTKHKGDGKLLMSSGDAMLTYSNSLASPYYGDSNGVTNKFLQLGSRRFRVVLENVSTFKTGRVLDFQEIQPCYNYLIGLPIFSIDYISTEYGMIATDFNTVQDLKSLGVQNAIQPTDIISEIYNSLIVYGKVK